MSAAVPALPSAKSTMTSACAVFSPSSASSASNSLASALRARPTSAPTASRLRNERSSYTGDSVDLIASATIARAMVSLRAAARQCGCVTSETRRSAAAAQAVLVDGVARLQAVQVEFLVAHDRLAGVRGAPVRDVGLVVRHADHQPRGARGPLTCGAQELHRARLGRHGADFARR